jgi:hypothetical protein
MVDFFSDSKDLEDARAVLLKHYSSECVIHGAYIIAIAVGLLSFIGVLPYFWSITLFTRIAMLALISSILLTLAIHILGRALFWSYVASAVIRVAPKKESEIEEGTTATFLWLLHQACTDYVRKKHKIAGAFYTLRMWEIELWFIFFIGFLLGWLIPSL